VALELLTFLGLGLFLEGIVFALFPSGVRGMLDRFAVLTPQKLRIIGLGFAVVAALMLVILARVSDRGTGAGMSFDFSMTRHFVASLF